MGAILDNTPVGRQEHLLFSPSFLYVFLTGIDRDGAKTAVIIIALLMELPPGERRHSPGPQEVSC